MGAKATYHSGKLSPLAMGCGSDGVPWSNVTLNNAAPVVGRAKTPRAGDQVNVYEVEIPSRATATPNGL